MKYANSFAKPRPIVLPWCALPLRQVKKSEGRIINVSSITALTCGTVCSSPYGASKHALEYFTSTLRMELKPFNVKVQRRPKGR